MKTLQHSLLFLLFVSCTQKKEQVIQSPVTPASLTAVTLSPDQIQAAGITFGKVERRALSGTIQAMGMLDVPPQHLVVITAPLGGFLRSTILLQGMRIKKGQSIAVIENPEYIQLQQDYLDTKSQVSFLESEYQRQAELAKENVNAQKVLQKSLADLNSMKARNNGLRSKLVMINLAPDNLDASSIRSTIELRSPISGYVTQVNAAIGAFVSATDPLFKIVDTAHLHAELTVFERDIPKLKIGERVRFTLANESIERTAKVYLIGREISADRSVRVHCHLDKEDVNLIPGLFLRAAIESSVEQTPSLPEEAVVNYEDNHYIFVRDKINGGLFRMVEVVAGVSDHGFVEVHPATDVDVNDAEVVVRGAYKLLSKLKNQEIGDLPGH